MAATKKQQILISVILRIKIFHTQVTQS
uniref:Uncharacterized protein n=1 Tax=Heterorhabditis bacteriophora TaxID=37862 RepID=A0A1I7X7Z9_HETBA